MSSEIPPLDGLSYLDTYGALDDLKWQVDAKCPDEGPEIFIDGKAGKYITLEKAEKAAKAICADCDVRAECLDISFELEKDYPNLRSTEGIWGGMTKLQRSRFKGELKREMPDTSIESIRELLELRDKNKRNR